ALYLAERHEDALAVARDRFFNDGLRAPVVREISAAGKNRQRKTRADGPDTAVPIEQTFNVAADVTTRTREPQHGKERCLRHPDAGIRGGKLALRLRSIAPALPQVPRR